MNGRNNKLMAKLISLLLAVILWFYVAGTQAAKEPNTIEHVPIKVEGLADGYVVSMMSEKQASVKLRSGGIFLPSLEDKENVLFVDLKDKRPGEYVVPVKLKALTGNLEVEEIMPSQISIVIDKTVKKKMPVQIGNSSTQPGDKAVLPISIDPQEVTVVGPSQEIAQARIATVEIDSENDSKSDDVSTITREIKILDKNGKQLKELTSIPKKIKVTVSYVPAKSVPISVETVGLPPAGYSVVSIQVNPSSVYIKGKPENLKKITSLKTVPVDLNGSMVSFTRDIGLILPPGIFIADGETPQLSVIISQASMKKTIDGIKPELKGAKSAVQYKIDPDMLSLSVSGSPHDIEQLQAADIKAVADVSAIAAGQTGKVELEVRLPQGIALDAVPEVSVAATAAQ